MSDETICEPCGKAILEGHLCRSYEDVGEAHADCEDPFGKTYPDPDRIPADPSEWEDESDAPEFLRTHRFQP